MVEIKEMPELKNESPDGIYGVYCEPKGHINNSKFLNQNEMTYDEAIKLADDMNRSNKSWHYYAKWIR